MIRYSSRQWTMRIVGLMLLGMLGAANLVRSRFKLLATSLTSSPVQLLRTRLPPRPTRASGFFNFAAFKSRPYSLYVTGTFIGFLGIYTPLTFIAVSATRFAHPPVSPEFAFYLVSFSNVMSLLGRVSAGLLSDRFGCLNILCPSLLLAAVATFVWPLATTKATLIGISIAYG